MTVNTTLKVLEAENKKEILGHNATILCKCFINSQLLIFKHRTPFGLRSTISDRPLSTLIEIGVYKTNNIQCTPSPDED